MTYLWTFEKPNNELMYQDTFDVHRKLQNLREIRIAMSMAIGHNEGGL